jgi:hypothetical protein
MNPLRHATRILKKQINQKARQATEAAGGSGRINVTGARNVVVSGTAGGHGSVDATSARQSVHVRQRDGETVDETESRTADEGCLKL